MTASRRVMLGVLLTSGLLLSGCTDTDDRSTDAVADAPAVAPVIDGRELLTPPSSQWTVRPSDIAPGAEVLTVPETEQPAVYLADDAVVVSVHTDGNRVLAGLDPDDGTVLWRQSDEYDGQCWTVDAGAAIVCANLEHEELRLLDPSTGTAQGTFAARAYHVVDAGSSIYVLSDGIEAPHDHSVRVSKLATSELEELWTSVGDDPGTGGGRGDDLFTTDLTVSTDRVAAHNGRLFWAFDSASGDVISTGPVQSGVERHGDYVLATDYRHAPPRVRVTDASGRIVLRDVTYPWDAWGLGGKVVVVDRAGFRDRLYDLTTGEIVWKRPGLFEIDPETGAGGWWSWTPDHRQVLATGADPGAGTTVLDAATGATMWTVDEALQPDGTLFAEAVVAVLGSSGANVTVIDRETGEIAWTRSLSGLTGRGGSYRSPELNSFAMSEKTIIAYNDWAVTGFTAAAS